MRMWAALLLPLALVAQSPEKAAALGKRLAAETERHYDVLHDPDASAYLSRLGARMAAPAGYHGPLAIRVLKENTPRNIVFPGGYVYLSSGLIGVMSSEAGLAGILAHDVAHFADPGAQLAGPSPAGLTIWHGCALSGEWLPGGLANSEPAANRDAVRWLAAAGYDPTALPELYHRLLKQDAEARSLLEYVRANLPPAPAAILSTAEFTRTQQRIAPPRRAPSLFRP